MITVLVYGRGIPGSFLRRLAGVIEEITGEKVVLHEITVSRTLIHNNTWEDDRGVTIHIVGLGGLPAKLLDPLDILQDESDSPEVHEIYYL